MVQYIFTPWRDQRELLTVRRQLYPAQHDAGLAKADPPRLLRETQEAVARVSMWMQRGNCPHLVESTALLQAAIESDRLAGRESGLAASAGAYAVRAAYSAAFSRFVTGLLDSHQDKQRKMSMYAVAKSVGLPATFVELRHQATHEQLPSLTRLRAAAEKALGWIWEYYWRHLVDDGVAAGSMRVAEEGTGRTSEHALAKSLLMQYLTTDDDTIQTRLRTEIGHRNEGVVLRALSEISEESKDVKVLRRTLVLEREILQTGSDRMDEDGGEGASRDLEAVRSELNRGKSQLEKAEDVSSNPAVVVEDPGKPDDEGPAWSRYDKGSWVPKPIGVV